MDQIFLRAVRHLLDPPGDNARRNEYEISYCTESGEIISGRVVCTSSSFKNDTFNFKFTESGEVRTAHACLLLSLNGKEILP